MVFVNSKKFACESCIKGHRSSSCHHSERPLFEIKKKGRPVSQCEKCRLLRQSRKVHSKCTCNDSGEGTSSQAPATGSAKGKRFIPITPALPNGIKDILEAASNISKPADARQLVNSLLNPCKCKNSRRCKCLGMKDDNITPPNDDDCSGLTALAQAAELFERGSPSSSATPEPPRRKTPPPKPRLIARPNSPNRKRRKHTHPPPEPPRVELPPIHIPEFQGVDEVPTFGTMPSISEITSIAGSGCTCGLQCSCPGCVDHRGPEHASAEHGNCTDGSCGSCVDNQMGVELPTASSGLLRNFYKLAARLPEPPKIGASRAYSGTEPVNLPKLDCCGGQCGCPGGRCGCGKACDGCCEKHTMEKPLVLEQEKIPEPVVEDIEKKSCCCG